MVAPIIIIPSLARSTPLSDQSGGLNVCWPQDCHIEVEAKMQLEQSFVNIHARVRIIGHLRTPPSLPVCATKPMQRTKIIDSMQTGVEIHSRHAYTCNQKDSERDRDGNRETERDATTMYETDR